MAGFSHLSSDFDTFSIWYSIFSGYESQVCSNSPFMLSDTDNVTMKGQWLGRSEKSGRWKGRTRFASYIATSLITRLVTPRYAIQTHSAYSSSSSPIRHRVRRRHEYEQSTFIPRSEIYLNKPLARDTLQARRTERPTGGDDYVGFVPAEPILGVNAALRVVRRKTLWAERKIDEESRLDAC